MKILLDGIETGQKYVYFDGYVIPTTADGINIEGWHANHNLDLVPQVAGMADSTISDGLLSSREYWHANRVEA